MSIQGMHTEEMIEEYILERLPSARRLLVEEALRQDADLLFEYKFQRDLIHCLRRFRMGELRHRLEMSVF